MEGMGRGWGGVSTFWEPGIRHTKIPSPPSRIHLNTFSHVPLTYPARRTTYLRNSASDPSFRHSVVQYTVYVTYRKN
jgi:hypothetical protein